MKVKDYLKKTNREIRQITITQTKREGGNYKQIRYKTKEGLEKEIVAIFYETSTKAIFFEVKDLN